MFLSDSMLLNISNGYSAVKILGKLGSLYQSKYLVNKLFMQNKLYHLKMDDNDTVTDTIGFEPKIRLQNPTSSNISHGCVEQQSLKRISIKKYL